MNRLIFLLLAAICLLFTFATKPNQDTLIYHCYAQSFFFGGDGLTAQAARICPLFVPHISPAPFHTIPAEYPVLSLLVFSAPLLLPFLSYDVAFALMISALIVWLFFYFRRHLSENSVFLFVLSIILCGATIGARFDLFPATLVLFSILFAEKKKFSKAYLFLSLATLLKPYPLILFLPLFLAEQRIWKGKSLFFWKRYRLINLSFVNFGASLLVGYLLSGNNAFNFIQFMLARPLQIESVPTSFLWLLSLVNQFSFCISFAYNSLGIKETVAGSCVPLISPSVQFLLITSASIVIFLVGFLVAIVRYRQNRWTLLQTAIALLLLTLSTSKVLSPQYLIWLLPLIVWDKTRAPFWMALWFFLLVLTALIHPWLYPFLSQSRNNPTHLLSESFFFTIVLLRNLTLIAATAFWYRMPTKVRAPK